MIPAPTHRSPAVSRHPRLLHEPVATLRATDAFRSQLDNTPGLAAELADHLGWSRQLITNIKAGRRGVRPEDAPVFEGFLGQPATVLFASPLIPVVPMNNPETQHHVASDSPGRPSPDYPPTVSAPALAELLGVSAATVYERVRDGTIRRIPLGGKGSRVLIPRSEVLRLLDQS